MSLPELEEEIRKCDICRHSLPLGPRPIVSLGANSKILLIGQAPGRKVHESGIPWDDASGDLLRQWLDIPRVNFYDSNVLSILPMGFCYPGKGQAGDLPPRPECAPQWHSKTLSLLSQVRLTIYVGAFAARYYLPEFEGQLTLAVQSFDSLLPTRIALPHPSPRNRPWLAKNPWFEREVLPALRSAVAQHLGPRL